MHQPNSEKHKSTAAVHDWSDGVRVQAHTVGRTIRIPGGSKTILEDVSFAVNPGEFVGIIGPSGCGKSTLMDVLNGRRSATAGRVMLNGTDFVHHRETFRRAIGYVPQKDIVHTLLTAGRALKYTARLRLPEGTPAAELAERVAHVLEQMRLSPHGNTTISNLSGGQIKRVSLAAELLSRPPLIYIDEATSGLDPATEQKMMALFKELAREQRKTVLCVTHSLEHINDCDHVAVMFRGRLTFFGPPAEALDHFEVRRLHEVYDLLEGQPNAERWADRFKCGSCFTRFVSNRLDDDKCVLPTADTDRSEAPPRPIEITSSDAPPVSVPVIHGSPTKVGRGSGWRQFLTLSSRYAELLWRDKATLAMTVLQAPLIGLLLAAALITLPHDLWQKKMPNLRKLSAFETDKIITLYRFGQVLQWAEGRWTPADTQRSGVDPSHLFFTALDSSGKPIPDGIPAMQLKEILEKNPLPDAGPATKPSILSFANFANPDMRATSEVAIQKLAKSIDAGAQSPGVALAVGTVGFVSKLAAFTPSGDAATLSIVLDGKNGPHETPSRGRIASWFKRFSPKKEEAKSPEHPAYNITKMIELDKSLRHFFPDFENPAKELLNAGGIPEGTAYNPILPWAITAVLAIAVFWFGCNNAAGEIVKEETIYARERAGGLKLLPYISSKFMILSLVSIAQALLLMGTVYAILAAAGVPFPTQTDVRRSSSFFGYFHVQSDAGAAHPEVFDVLLDQGGARTTVERANPNGWCAYFLTIREQCKVLGLLAVVAVACGLLISARVDTPESATAAAPYVLIPQILLCGASLPILSKTMEFFAGVLSPVYWANRALRTNTRHVPSVLWQFRENGDPPLWQNYAALGAYVGVILVVTLWQLKRKDRVH